jgi:phage tail sheath protein FI
VFGGLWQHGPMSAAVYDYFENGGQAAVVVRVKAKTCLLRSIWQFFQRTRNQNIGFAEIADSSLAARQQGIWAFNQTETLNLLCIPPFAPNLDVDPATWRAALDYCKERGSFLIIDAPSAWKSVEDLSLSIESMNLRDENAVMYFPYLEVGDRSNHIQQGAAAPCGMAAGVIARTDRTRGVWKAPAGVEAVLTGDPKPAVALSEADIGALSRLGVNSFHPIPNTGLAIWGARTLMGDDQHASEWKYIPVRRSAIFIELSLVKGLQWVVFEPNDEPLWQQIRSSVENFLYELFRQGALQGSTPKDAYFVRCGRDTMTQNDIDNGVVNLLVGFAMLRPAEFVIIRIQLNARQ